MSETENAPTEAADASNEQPTPIDFEESIRRQLVGDRDGDSHVEWDPKVFHPSQVGYSEWLLLVKKLGLSEQPDLDLLGTFKMGDLVHEFVQGTVMDDRYIHPHHIEGEIDLETDGLRFVGHYDLYDPTTDIVYDIKSRSSWYNFDPPVDRHLDQLHVYMKALDADYGQVVYVSKKDLEVRTWPEGAPFTFDDERWTTIVERCQAVRDALYENGVPRSEDEIPFERPDTYFANSTDLDFSAVEQ